MTITIIKLEGGKYTITHNNGCDLRALRYGQPWRDLRGDGLVLAMVHEIERLLNGPVITPDAQPAKAALRELVALKRMHDAIEAAEAKGTDNFVGGVAIPFAKDDYEKRKAKAWRQAFELVDFMEAAA